MLGRISDGVVALAATLNFIKLVLGYELGPMYVGSALLVLIVVYTERAFNPKAKP